MHDNLITIYKRLESQNTFQGAHWSKKNKDRQHWQIYLTHAINGRVEPPTELRRVVIISYRARLILDNANLVGGAKGLVDAIVNVGLLRDDSDEWAQIEYQQIKCKKVDERTTIQVDGFNPISELNTAGMQRHPKGTRGKQ